MIQELCLESDRKYNKANQFGKNIYTPGHKFQKDLMLK